MNLGFYIDQVNGEENNVAIFNALNKGIENGDLDNASVFYKEIGHNPVEPKFSLFNSSDIWYYTGTLIATSIDTLTDAIKAINKYDLVYLFSKKTKYSIFHLISIIQNCKVIVSTKEDEQEFYRVTGIKPIYLENLEADTIKKGLQ